MSRYDYDELYVIAPGETIKELLEVNCMNQLDLASKIGINKKTVNEIINGKAPITTETALKLEYVFGLPASFWNNLESNYRIALERKKDIDLIKNEVIYLENIPYLEMSKRKWDGISATKDPFLRVINLRKFFGVASLNFDTELRKKIACRKSSSDHFSLDALYCYLRYGEIQSNKLEYPKFDVEKLKDNAKKIRKLTNKMFLPQLDEIRKLLSECGVALIFEPHLPNTYINGVAYKITPDKAIIMISDKGKQDDILWFTLFHEIAHLIKHSKKDVFIDNLESGLVNDIERDADNYAKNILIPDNDYCNFVNGVITEKSIIDFSKTLNILPGILVGRLHKDKIIPWNRYNKLVNRI